MELKDMSNAKLEKEVSTVEKPEDKEFLRFAEADIPGSVINKVPGTPGYVPIATMMERVRYFKAGIEAARRLSNLPETPKGSITEGELVPGAVLITPEGERLQIRECEYGPAIYFDNCEADRMMVSWLFSWQLNKGFRVEPPSASPNGEGER